MADKSFFDDLPDEQQERAEEPKEETSADAKEKESEMLKNLEKAKKREESRIEKARRELEEKRKERKQIEAKKEKPEDADVEEAEDVEEEPKQDVVKATVEATLRERDERKRLDDLRGEVRKYAKTRQEAEKMYEEALRLPPDWGNEQIAHLAADRVQVLKDQNRGFVMPSVSGGGFADMSSRVSDDEIEGMSKERIKYLKDRGWTTEDIKKFKDGPDLTRIWPGNKVLHESFVKGNR